MGFNCGIVGLPNVGKSTIFNALTAVGAEAANYPFCTIEPNTGVVPVPDERQNVLAKMNGSSKVIPTFIEFVDIAGLVEGASKGEGLGNQFLSHIRAVDAIVHVVRCFEDSNVTHVYGEPSPRRDVEVIETELMLSDLGTVEKRIERVQKPAKLGEKAAIAELALLEVCRLRLNAGKSLQGIEDPEGVIKNLGLLTAKPSLFVANVAEEDAALDATSPPVDKLSGRMLAELNAVAAERSAQLVVISGRVESEIAELDEAEKRGFLNAVGLEQSGLDRLAVAGYKLLDLITFFTAGPKETRAWTCVRGTLAPQAAGKIHSDFERGFIRAEVISYDDYVRAGGEAGAREKGTLRTEGKGCEMRDGDVVHFRFNV